MIDCLMMVMELLNTTLGNSSLYTSTISKNPKPRASPRQIVHFDPRCGYPHHGGYIHKIHSDLVFSSVATNYPGITASGAKTVTRYYEVSLMKDWRKQVSSVIESGNVGPRNLCKGSLRGGPDLAEQRLIMGPHLRIIFRAFLLNFPLTSARPRCAPCRMLSFDTIKKPNE